MSKKLCRESDRLEYKISDRKMKYLCTKCDKESPKEKWCCKPRKIKR
jgi:hypothetical protein